VVLLLGYEIIALFVAYSQFWAFLASVVGPYPVRIFLWVYLAAGIPLAWIESGELMPGYRPRWIREKFPVTTDQSRS